MLRFIVFLFLCVSLNVNAAEVSNKIKTHKTHHAPVVSLNVDEKVEDNDSDGSKHPGQPAEPDPEPALKEKKCKPHCKTKIQSTSYAFKWPVRGPILSKKTPANKVPKGLDIGGREGTPIKAAGPGMVVYSGNGLKSYGKLIIIKHNESFLSAYAHNQELLVKEGEQVKTGQAIARMGKTGSDKVKLHFEIRYLGKQVDPLKYLPKVG